MEHVKKVLERLKEEKIVNKLEEVYFSKEELIYLGFVVSKEGLKMDPDKVKYILDWPTPKCTFYVRSFHGLSSFYQKIYQKFQQDLCTSYRVYEERNFPMDNNNNEVF
jgi:hypothetical protein